MLFLAYAVVMVQETVSEAVLGNQTFVGCIEAEPVVVLRLLLAVQEAQWSSCISC